MFFKIFQKKTKISKPFASFQTIQNLDFSSSANHGGRHFFKPRLPNYFSAATALILVKKVIILRKIQGTMKTSVLPFFNHFSLSLIRQKRVVMRAGRKKLNIFRFNCRFITYQNRKSRLVQIQILLKPSKRNRLFLLQRGEHNAYCLA